MNTLPKISVIVPIYKVERYLGKCIDSLLQQTFGSIEFILVDDGSPDQCPQICDEYAKKDSRIKVVHKANGGLSSARNAGIQQAVGEWIGFIDSDDYIEPTMYEKLYNAVTEHNADLAVCDFMMVDEDGTPILNDYLALASEVLDQRGIFSKLDIRKQRESQCMRFVTAWNKLYKKDIFTSCRFKEGVLHEDEFFVHRMLAQCQTVSVVGEVLYYYVQRTGSIMNGTFTAKRLDGVVAFLDRYNFFVESGYSDLAVSPLLSAYGNLIGYVFKNKGAAKYHREIASFVMKVTMGLIKKGNLLRAIKLLLLYIGFCIKSTERE